MKLAYSLKPVDYTMTDELTPPDKHPLYYLDMVFDRLRPDVYVVNEDTFDIPYRREFSKKHGMELVVFKRWCPPEFDGISTMKRISKIKDGGS